MALKNSWTLVPATAHLQFLRAKKITGKVYAYDIEETLNSGTRLQTKKDNIKNVILYNKDFINERTSFQNDEVDFVTLFNILHAEKIPQIF